MKKSFGHSFASFVPLLTLLPFLFVDLKIAAGMLGAVAFLLWLHFKVKLVNRNVYYILVAAFALRFLLILANEYLGLLPLQPDALHYSAQAMKIVDNQMRHLPLFYDVPYSLSVKSYSFFLSLFYDVLGEMPFFAALVNVILGILSSLLIYKIAMLIFEDERIAFASMTISLFFPSIIAFTSYVLRDALVMYLTLNMIFYFSLYLQKNKAIQNFIKAVFFFLLVGILRIQNFYLYALLFLLFALILLFESKNRLLLKFGVLTLLAFCLVFIFARYGDFIMTIVTYPMRAQPLRARGGSAYLVGMQYNSMFDFLFYLPIRFFFFAFGPFLWNAGGAFQLLTAVEGLFVFTAFVLTVQFAIKKRFVNFSKAELFLLMFCFLGLAANAMVDSNFGTAVRHRMQYIIFLFIFAAAYLRNIKMKLI